MTHDIIAADQLETAFDQPMLLGESPLWHAEEGALYWIDIPGKAVHRLQVERGQHQSWPMPHEPGAIARHAQGGLVVALRSGMAHLDTGTGALAPLLEAPYDTERIRFNDGRCDAAGRFWCGTIYEPRDRDGGTLYSFERDVLRDAHHAVVTSNGVAFSPDQRLMYHSNTPSHRINVYDFDLATGATSNCRLLRQFDSDKSAADYGGRPDGAAVDSEGAYWVAMFEGARVLRLSAQGEILQEVRLPARCPTMVAFGGADLRTLYITTGRHGRSEEELRRYPLSGHVLKLRVDVAGRLEYSYRP
ncbi:SMP-30/gluconolactonase/LRE family protein [Herbaspirillum sp. alder98]|uniref:SMP-30/gluconolactonase/LRE family protein n=1 Tax=Herbaspirillum sp. alder98 TaxID=2913096 RepID=UPI001CD87A39|nr:SMP-30/gluconolactonase/LRE family protein [Herbaspirillum sp. alder98]MCA1326990.1 SMP-30/gluconolactonase/LRE family protein [Herbaspirillum sp. alder98]